ncbi:MAG TPA: phosphatidylserine decarboxylase family protein [Candidatus Deferrimicrobiaceae bacterium]
MNPESPLRGAGGIIAPEGWPFILAPLLLGVAVWWFFPRAWPAAAVLLLLSAFSLWFFRNPERTPPPDPGGHVIAPADGTVIDVGDVPAGRYLSAPGRRVCIFMTPLNVHVNRAPVAGKVVKVLYNKGKYFAANAEKASLENEQNGVTIETPAGVPVTYVQIAGFIARRIVCDVKPGDAVRRGGRVGLIRFGSRVDVYLPPSFEAKVRVGDKTTAGETLLGVLR